MQNSKPEPLGLYSVVLKQRAWTSWSLGLSICRMGDRFISYTVGETTALKKATLGKSFWGNPAVSFWQETSPGVSVCREALVGLR